MIKHKQESFNMTVDSLMHDETLLGNKGKFEDSDNDEDDEMLINDFKINGDDTKIDDLNLLRHSRSQVPAEFRES